VSLQRQRGVLADGVEGGEENTESVRAGQRHVRLLEWVGPVTDAPGPSRGRRGFAALQMLRLPLPGRRCRSPSTSSRAHLAQAGRIDADLALPHVPNLRVDGGESPTGSQPPHIARSRYSRTACSTANKVAPARVATPILS